MFTENCEVNFEWNYKKMIELLKSEPMLNCRSQLIITTAQTQTAGAANQPLLLTIGLLYRLNGNYAIIGTI